MKKQIQDYKARLSKEIVDCMAQPISARSVDEVSAMSECWAHVTEIETSAMEDDEPLTKKEAAEWVEKMRHEDGSTGARWSIEQVMPYMSPRGIYDKPEIFWACVHLMHADYCRVAKNYGVDTLDFYADMAAAFLKDRDAVPDKAGTYYRFISA